MDFNQQIAQAYQEKVRRQEEAERRQQIEQDERDAPLAVEFETKLTEILGEELFQEVDIMGHVHEGTARGEFSFYGENFRIFLEDKKLNLVSGPHHRTLLSVSTDPKYREELLFQILAFLGEVAANATSHKVKVNVELTFNMVATNPESAVNMAVKETKEFIECGGFDGEVREVTSS